MTDVPRPCPDKFVLELAQAQAFAGACGGSFAPSSPRVGHGAPWAPPMAVAIGTLVQGVQPILRAALRPELLGHVVHREESITWHRPFCLNTPYRIVGTLLQHEQRRAGGLVQVGIEVQDALGTAAVSSCSTLFVRPPGRLKPSASQVPSASSAPASSQEALRLEPWFVAPDQPARYARASLESNPIHLDDAVAQAAGLPGRILHGMCTLGYSARVLTDHIGASAQAGPFASAGPPALTHIAARFAKPVFPGDTLTCRVTLGPASTLHFDVVQQHGTVVLNRGIARFEKTA